MVYTLYHVQPVSFTVIDKQWLVRCHKLTLIILPVFPPYCKVNFIVTVEFRV